MSLQDAIDRALDELYSVPGNPCAITRFLDALACLVSGDAVAFVLFDQRNDKYAINNNTGFPPDVSRSYAEHYAAIDEWYKRGRLSTKPGDVLNGQALLSIGDLRRTEFYNDFLLPNDWIHECAAVIEAESTSISALTFLRTSRKQDFSETDLRAIEALVPHVQRVMRLHRNFVDLQAQANSRAWALDQVTFAVILVRADGTMIQANRAAESLCREGFFRINNGRLQFTSPVKRDINKLLLDCLRPNAEAPAPFEIVRKPHGDPLLVSVSRIPAPDFMGAQFAIFIHDPRRQPNFPDGLLCKLYNLTPAEARLAVLLAQNHSVQEIADLLHLSKQTIRTQLKTVFLKLGVHRQSQVTRLVSNISPQVVSAK